MTPDTCLNTQNKLKNQNQKKVTTGGGVKSEHTTEEKDTDNYLFIY